MWGATKGAMKRHAQFQSITCLVVQAEKQNHTLWQVNFPNVTKVDEINDYARTFLYYVQFNLSWVAKLHFAIQFSWQLSPMQIRELAELPQLN